MSDRNPKVAAHAPGQLGACNDLAMQIKDATSAARVTLVMLGSLPIAATPSRLVGGATTYA